LFCSRGELKKLIAGIVTDSRMPGEAKDADASNVFELYRAFATTDETAAMRQAFADGIGWGDAKQKLFERIDAEVAPLRELYEALIAEPARIEDLLHVGAGKARAIAKPLLTKLREAVGLRNLASDRLSVHPENRKKKKQFADGPTVYKEHDGFHCRIDESNRVIARTRQGMSSYSDIGLALTRVDVEGGSAFNEFFRAEDESVGVAHVVEFIQRHRKFWAI
jgi:tryptophanyl-tRNA synthetase